MIPAFTGIRSGVVRGMRQLLIPHVLAANARLGRYRNVVWVIGDGRSGTTWLQELLAWSFRYRTMYEPFHPLSGPAGQLFPPNLYLRVTDQDPSRLALADHVFRGGYRHPNVDRDNRRILYDGIVIKDVFAHLFAAWALRHFPFLRIVLIVRDPFEAARSKLEHREWLWMEDARDFLTQQTLVDDYLDPFVDFIRASDTDFVQQQILIWSIVHYVLLKQLGGQGLSRVRYETMVENPQRTLAMLQGFLRRPGDRRPRTPDPHRIRKPSRGSESISSTTGTVRRSLLDSGRIEAGLKTIDHFGLAWLVDHFEGK